MFKKFILILSLFIFGCSGDDIVKASNDASIDSTTDIQMNDSSTDVQQNFDGHLETSFTHLDAGHWDGNFDFKSPSTSPINYYGGKVMINPIDIYFIYYGDWSKNKQTQVILEDLITNLGASDYWKINAQYYQIGSGINRNLPNGIKPDILQDSGIDSSDIKLYATSIIKLAKTFNVEYTHGKSISESEIQLIIAETLLSNNLQPNENSIYIVLTSGDVNEGGWWGFGALYCAYHSRVSVNGINIKYAFVGDMSLRFEDACSVRSAYEESGFANSPNGDWSADEMASTLIHELSEISNDPDPFIPYIAWQNADGYESADNCAWVYSQLYITNNNSVANVRIGNRDFLIQELWDINLPDGGQGCALFH